MDLGRERWDGERDEPVQPAGVVGGEVSSNVRRDEAFLEREVERGEAEADLLDPASTLSASLLSPTRNPVVEWKYRRKS
jgi:hypothetical protein